MRKMILVLAGVCGLSLCGVAQSSSDAGMPNNGGQSAGAPSKSGSGGSSTMMVDGCLSGSNGHYMVKDKKSGTSYMLTGATSKLEKHVGHEVQVTGTISSSGAASAASGMSDTSGQKTSGNGSTDSQTLNVTSMKHVAETCSAGM